MGIAARESAMMREAASLSAARSELGNSGAIRLLQIPHSTQDVEEVLHAFGKQLSREAKSKLMLDAFVPPPSGVVNQRYERIFDKHIITGKTYTTASGTVVPNELQYYNGEMAHLYGECANVPAVEAALAGSGYKAVTLKYADGTQTAVAQLWSSRFTDTSIGPYSALFTLVVVVPDDGQHGEASIRADANGASSVLPMFDGSFDPATSVYENTRRLFLVRLLDTTQVAIDVGRERMGTDKRPGTVDMTRSGRRLRVSITDQYQRAVVKADLQLADDPGEFMAEVAQAAATAGISLREFPRGTEYVYPAVARIGHGPVVSWQWRTDLAPRLQRLAPSTVVFDPSSEEGRMLLRWGFTPKALGYIANVRGLITGLGQGAAVRVQSETVPVFSAAFLEEPAHVVGQLPVLRFRLDESSSRGGTPINPPPYEARPRAEEAVSSQPRWAWDTTFLGSLTALLRKEGVGVTPDGLRINWHVTKGRFVGPGFDAIVLPGAADWMRIRRDGVGIVSVQACFETKEGARVYGSYGGMFDLGVDGYARALRDEYDQLPPVVVAPTYATADGRLEWLNRAQCIGVGRVDMAALRVEFDVYVVRVGTQARRASSDEDRVRARDASLPATLYSRLGGRDVIVGITDDFVAAVLADPRLRRYFPNAQGQNAQGLADLEKRVVELLCETSGGPCVYTGRDMKTVHKGMGITEGDWNTAVDLFTGALKRRHLAPREQSEFLQIIHDMKSAIVEGSGTSWSPTSSAER
jgi:truncated hemoglobin YjbI